MLARHPFIYWTIVVALAMAVATTTPTQPPSPVTAVGVRPGLPAGTRGVVVGLGSPRLPVRSGDTVDVVGIAEELVVIELVDDGALVAVPEADVAEVSAAVAEERAMVVMRSRQQPDAVVSQPEVDGTILGDHGLAGSL